MAKLDLTTDWQLIGNVGIVCSGTSGSGRVELAVATSQPPAGPVDDALGVDASSNFFYPAPSAGDFYARVNEGVGTLKFYEV